MHTLSPLALPGIDIQHAYSLIGKDPVFLVTLLREFTANALDVEETLNLSLDKAATTDCLRKLHQLRGGAGNLGAESIRRHVSILEGRLQEFQANPLPPHSVPESFVLDLKGLRFAIRDELERLNEALRALPKDGDVPVAAPSDLESGEFKCKKGNTVLVIDDSPAMRSYLKATLLESFDDLEVIEASDGLSGFRLMLERLPDLALCDLQMPGFDGLKLLAMRASRKELIDTPIIMLTAEQEPETKVQVLTNGAADYVTKPFHRQELAARVRVHLGLKRAKDELTEANLRLEQLAVTDALTGIYNRRRFDQLLHEEMERTARYGTPLSVVLLDIDHFKSINDTHGHQMGDEVLRNLGRLLKATIRTTDRAARYGGEEFIVLLPHTDLTGAIGTGERLRVQIEACRHKLGGTSIGCTASIGVACTTGEGMTSEMLVDRADKALYSVKESGRNGVKPWDADMEKTSAPASGHSRAG